VHHNNAKGAALTQEETILTQEGSDEGRNAQEAEANPFSPFPIRFSFISNRDTQTIRNRRNSKKTIITAQF